MSAAPLDAPRANDAEVLRDDDPEALLIGDGTAAENAAFEAEVAEEPQLPTAFIHRDEVMEIITGCIAQLKGVAEAKAADGTTVLPYKGAFLVPTIGEDPTHVQARLFKMEHLMAIYQEAPTLLLAHLEELMAPLLEAVLYFMPRSIDQMKDITSDADNATNTTAAPIHTLGKDYNEYDADSSKTALHNVCRALYFVVKVAGPKACTSHLPHDVKLLEDVFYCLRRWQTDASVKREWEVRYCFLLWLSSLVLVPFDFRNIDSQIGGSVPLSQQLLESAWEFLSEPSKCREAAALLIARLNTRPDSLEHRKLFFSRAIDAVQTGDNVLRNGVLLAIATTHKFGKREELVQYSPSLIPIVGEITHASKDVKTAKTAVKVLQRLGLSLLKKRQASWKYRQTVRSLEVNLAANGVGVIDTTAAASKPTADDDNANEDDEEGVPDVIEDVIGYLLSSLSHSDTIVRWSAAKGIGRLCARLPQEMAHDVVMAVLEVFALFEDDSGWHGGLLALAELCRGSILLPDIFDKAMPLVAKGLHYEISKGSFSVGAHVRDAACYVCWSVARAYNPSDLTGYAHSLSTALISTALFDREVNVRRAAAAAFQECVGRLGNFPNGIDLVTTMDFFSLATTRNAYLVVAPQVAKYEAYRSYLMEHLFKTKVVHWDRNVRQYAAEALSIISESDCDKAVSEYFPSLVNQAKETSEVSIRHGSILAVAAMMKTLPSLPQESVDAAVNIIPTLDSKRHFRGRGVEYVRQACCRFVLNLSGARRKLPDHVEVIKLTGQKGKAATKGNLQRFLEDTWKQPLEWLQWEAVDAFLAFSKEYYHPYSEAFHGKVFTGMCQGVAETKAPNERRGNAAAMGAISLSMALAPVPASATAAPASSSTAAGNATDDTAAQPIATIPARLIYQEAFDVLCSLTVLGANKDTQDAETRRNAVKAMATLAQTLGAANLTLASFIQCGNAIINNAFTDYAVDKRGDVGSYVRVQALQDMPNLILAALDAGLFKGDADTTAAAKKVLLSYVQSALKQGVEKIDRVRSIALTSLKQLMTHGSDGSAMNAELTGILAAAGVPAADLEALTAVLTSSIVDWAAPQETFPVIVGNLIRTKTFGPHVMEGMPVSVGGLSLHVLRSAQSALFDAFTIDKVGLTRSLVEVAARYAHSERVVVPICTTMEKLIEKQLFAEEHLGDVVDMLVVETQHFATDINRLLSFIPLLGALCQSPVAAVRKAAWHHALVLVASRYPRVRSRVATDLYTAVLMTSVRDEVLAEAEVAGQDWCAAMDVLTTSQWEDTDVAVVKGARDSLYALLGLKPEDAAEGYATGALTMTAEDALRSNKAAKLGTYTSLVHEMGY